MQKLYIKFVSTLLLSLVFCSQTSAQRSSVMLQRILNDADKKEKITSRINTRSDSQPKDTITHYPVIIELEDGEDAETVFGKLEAVIYHNRGNIYLTSIPIDKLEEIPRSGGINGFHVSSSLAGNLDVAREVTRVNDVHRELNIIDRITSEPSGKVVTGICDIGFDPRHQAFRNCLKRWVIYDEYHGKKDVYDGYDTIVSEGPLTDTTTDTHATHVGNILAGYSADNPYYGVAPTSDFVATVSKLSEVGICSGIEDIIEYAKASGKRAVVNISAGSYLGPHDGKDLVGRYLSAMSEDAVICFSAGNYGARNNSQSLNLDDYTSPVGSGWCDTKTWCGFDVTGGTDLWSRDSKPFEFRLVVCKSSTREILYATEWMGGNAPEGEYFLDLEATPWFTEGGVWCAWGVYEQNKRFNVAFEYDYHNDTFFPNQAWTDHAVGYEIRKVTDGTHVDAYADGIQTFLHGMYIPTAIGASGDGSISNLACCPDVAAIGAWTSRSVVPDVEFGQRDWGLAVNRVPNWTAYGTSGDGRKMPHFCAPGNTLVSALSTPHYHSEKLVEEASHPCYISGEYRYYAEAGTSMASPFAAGVFALWLEEDSDLDIHALVDVAMKTANRNFADITDPRWGAGALDACAGLTEVRSRLGVGDVSIDNRIKPIVFIENGWPKVEWSGVEHPAIAVYDLSGRQLRQTGNLPTPLVVKVSNPANGESYTYKLR